MRSIILSIVAVANVLAFTTPSSAHGDEPHPKCKKGYVLTDDHKCVRASG